MSKQFTYWSETTINNTIDMPTTKLNASFHLHRTLLATEALVLQVHMGITLYYPTSNRRSSANNLTNYCKDFYLGPTHTMTADLHLQTSYRLNYFYTTVITI